MSVESRNTYGCRWGGGWYLSDGQQSQQIFAPVCVDTTIPSPILAETLSLGRCLTSESLQALKRLKNAFSADSRRGPMGKEN
jgi:hypothetical protein